MITPVYRIKSASSGIYTGAFIICNERYHEFIERFDSFLFKFDGLSFDLNEDKVAEIAFYPTKETVHFKGYHVTIEIGSLDGITKYVEFDTNAIEIADKVEIMMKNIKGLTVFFTNLESSIYMIGEI